MIVVTKERYIPVMVNMIVLTKGEHYFYIHRDVYDQAVILSDRYREFSQLSELVGGKDVNGETAAWFYESAPKPLHIFAPYLLLIDGVIDKDMEQACGVLHVITSMIHVRQFIEKPPEIRRSVSFSLSIKEEYEMAWDRFIASSIPYDQRGSLIGGQQLAAGAAIDRQEQPVSVTDTIALFPHTVAQIGRPSDKGAYTVAAAKEAERSATRNLLMR
ncbi:hypothetical protein [Paenibacillus xylaniclasticus]|uniref:hypothetical protein n=1 Tax=Paenibacillus xylaniclasticus TaxID=588083 RepID=UPI000FD83A30|nr:MULTISPECIES: hypothetical protein [Paenibacillus]GFN30943.1 hypothetical protein PCURB6_12030 [Paenibacillus curdlanolyticus]